MKNKLCTDVSFSSGGDKDTVFLHMEDCITSQLALCNSNNYFLYRYQEYARAFIVAGGQRCYI